MPVHIPERSSEDSGVKSVLRRLGHRWSILVIVLLGDGPKRFKELKSLSGGISDRMLTYTLQGLERDGLVTRTQYLKIPPHVEYALTRLGVSLLQALDPLSRWAREHAKDLGRVKVRFENDAKTKSARRRKPIVS